MDGFGEYLHVAMEVFGRRCRAHRDHVLAPGEKDAAVEGAQVKQGLAPSFAPAAVPAAVLGLGHSQYSA